MFRLFLISLVSIVISYLTLGASWLTACSCLGLAGACTGRSSIQQPSAANRRCANYLPEEKNSRKHIMDSYQMKCDSGMERWWNSMSAFLGWSLPGQSLHHACLSAALLPQGACFHPWSGDVWGQRWLMCIALQNSSTCSPDLLCRSFKICFLFKYSHREGWCNCSLREP